MPSASVVEISPVEAARYLVGQMGLRAVVHPPGLEGALAALRARRCIQLDPLDRIGTNADLVVMARVDGLGRGDLFRAAYPGEAFEHFAKERCLLPAVAFPQYRDQAVETPWWRSTERQRRVAPAVLEAVLSEVRARGPLTAADLADQGRVTPMDWSGWQSTGRAATMALEVLWTRCAVVTCGRAGRRRVFDLPERALPTVASDTPKGPFGRWAVGERVEAAGLLPRASGPWWSMLQAARTGPAVADLLAAGDLVEVRIEGSRRTYLAPADFRDRGFPEHDGRMRILGPLDPLLWCRDLVRHVFDFDYVWEVYKPSHARRWGWYVCPLLHLGRLVGRFEGRIVAGEVVVDTVWPEPGVAFDERAFRAALERHAAHEQPGGRAP